MAHVCQKTQIEHEHWNIKRIGENRPFNYEQLLFKNVKKRRKTCFRYNNEFVVFHDTQIKSLMCSW